MSRSAGSVAAFAAEHSLLLPAGALAALVWANTQQVSYARFAGALEFAVNDIGMVFFFALAAKEVIEATGHGGPLHTWQRAAVPVIAAAGGMLGPALIYLAVVNALHQPALARGWAIPCATDVAFSFLVAKIIYRRHPAIPFLLLLAIADDGFGLIILAAFYPAGALHVATGATLMAAALATSWGLRRRRVGVFWPYVVAGGALSWSALFLGGLHPALALVPIMPFLPRRARDPGPFVDAPTPSHDALGAFEWWWRYPVQGILFLFGLVNAGIPLRAAGAGTWAVLTALIAGKPLGIGAAVALALAAGLRLPAGLTWRDVAVVGCAAAVGFTVALFFATAAFPPGPLLDQTKMGALSSVAGGVAALGAATILRVGRATSREA